MFLFDSDLILIAAAVIPAAVLLWFVYKHDHLEKEPTKLLIKLLLWGVVSTAMAAAAETLGDVILSGFLSEGSLLYRLLFYFVVVGLSEEGFKYLMLKWKTWKSEEFNCQFDGVVYAVFVSLGFALWENIRYVITFGFATAVARALTAIPGHACFGVFMGAFYGAARRHAQAGRTEQSRQLRVLSLLVPTILHGAYDFFATNMAEGDAWYFLIFVAVFFFLAFKLVKRLSKEDRYIS